ncbi:ATP-binding protein [Actinoplanes sp. KI2]|uniref:ATP-binding protein n=1 Tax=Actinoplanes sp. KI2 TaxID=2983315 RepID=UPI0021D57FC2|nr:ATP-binding protein [Actinoplanes sp. KI2]MCU7731007.1 ATP-binding protein [Actinoplanes sp. KI2]
MLARTAMFALLYAAAIAVGRMTVLGDTRMALVWPASGVAVLWLCAQRNARTRWVDVAALTAIAWAGNTLTGTGPVQGVALAAANLTMAVVFVRLLGRSHRQLRCAGGRGRPANPWELGRLLGYSSAAAAAGAVIGLGGLWLAGVPVTGQAVVDWMARNVTGMFVIGAAGLWLGHTAAALAARHGSSPRGWWHAIDQRLRTVPARQVGEYLAVAAGSIGAYLVGFVYNQGLPLAFPLIVVTVWAALRLHTTFVVGQNLTLAAAAVWFTLHGHGPLASVADLDTRVLLVQLFVVVITTVGMIIALGRDERTTLLAELAAQQDKAARHGALLDAVINSMADGLAVVDADHRVLLSNPAAVRLLATPAGPRTSAGIRALLRHLDGTPVADEDLPNVRALAHGRIDPVNLLFGEPDTRDSRVFRVSATALPDDNGARQAVVLYHDVTAETRQREQLAAFAGAVAHDLQSPLTTVEGWTEVATDALATTGSNPGTDRARDSLTRVARAATRMRGLINDLLVYTATRDADLSPTRVELTDTVNDLAAARADAAAATGQPVPQVTVGALDPVHADAGAVRQLLDNLIGNAIKYIAPGVTPRLTVTSVHLDGSSPNNTVQVTIADNGIGIPAGQHEAIFGSFHRAHPGSEYAGTGLGLAICARIVARHGGAIAAYDNPGGGSRFIFTLPATAQAGVLAAIAPPVTLPVTPAPAPPRRTPPNRMAAKHLAA